MPEEPLRLPHKHTNRNQEVIEVLHSAFTDGASEIKDEFTRYDEQTGDTLQE
jgi:hypothetical protein